MDNTKTFEYNGYHFSPAGKFPPKMTHEQIMWRAGISHRDGFSNWENGPRYNYAAFYSAAASIGAGEQDLFLCVEDNLIYFPGLEALFHWPKKRT